MQFLGNEYGKCLGLGFGKFEGSRFGKKIFPVFLLLIRWFLWFAADVFFYIAERFFRRRIWEIAGVAGKRARSRILNRTGGVCKPRILNARGKGRERCGWWPCQLWQRCCKKSIVGNIWFFGFWDRWEKHWKSKKLIPSYSFR